MENLPLFLEQILLFPLSKGKEKGGLDVRAVATTWCSRQRLNCWQRQSGDEAMHHNEPPSPLEVKPGWVCFHSWKVRMGICCLSSVPARMVEATLTQFALRGEAAIGCRRTHGKQLPSALLPEVELFMPQQSPRAREGEREGAVTHAESRVVFPPPAEAEARVSG